MTKKNKIFIPVIIFTLVMFNMIFINNLIYADDEMQVIGNDNGLEIIPSNEKLFDFDNLNPGDVKNGTITIRNNYESPFNIYMRQERIGEAEEVDLLAQLILKISYEGKLLYEGSMKDFANDNTLLGKLETGDIKKLDITIILPGPETGNEFQGKNVKNKWIFLAQSEKVLGDYDEDIDKDEKTKTDDSQDKVAIPLVASATDENPKMPQTGEMVPYLLYGLGASSIIIGIILKLKK